MFSSSIELPKANYFDDFTYRDFTCLKDFQYLPTTGICFFFLFEVNQLKVEVLSFVNEKVTYGVKQHRICQGKH
jgi:hypothetical protein